MTTAEGAALRLQAWISPAFPTGGFAWSHGIEWAVEAGEIGDEATLAAWIGDLLAHGAGRTDAILLRHAHRAAGDGAALDELAELAAAAAPSRELQAETLGQGSAFVLAVAPWACPALDALAARRGGQVAYPIAFGAASGAHGIAVEGALLAFLQGFAANLVSAAVRLVPLGQTAGLRVLAALEPAILAVAEEARAAGLDALGNAAFRADIAAMRHETQYTRLFRS